MTLEERIKQLEKLLAIKQAFENVVFSFPKSIKVEDDVKDLVVSKLREVCSRLANEQESFVETEEKHEISKEELSILKQLAETVKSKSKIDQKDSSKSVKKEKVETKNRPIGKLLLLDNVPQYVRGRIQPEEEVILLSEPDEKGFVICKTVKTGVSISVPHQDIELT